MDALSRSSKAVDPAGGALRSSRGSGHAPRTSNSAQPATYDVVPTSQQQQGESAAAGLISDSLKPADFFAARPSRQSRASNDNMSIKGPLSTGIFVGDGKLIEVQTAEDVETTTANVAGLPPTAGAPGAVKTPPNKPATRAAQALQNKEQEDRDCSCSCEPRSARWPHWVLFSASIVMYIRCAYEFDHFVYGAATEHPLKGRRSPYNEFVKVLTEEDVRTYSISTRAWGAVQRGLAFRWSADAKISVLNGVPILDEGSAYFDAHAMFAWLCTLGNWQPVMLLDPTQQPPPGFEERTFNVASGLLVYTMMLFFVEAALATTLMFSGWTCCMKVREPRRSCGSAMLVGATVGLAGMSCFFHGVRWSTALSLMSDDQKSPLFHTDTPLFGIVEHDTIWFLAVVAILVGVVGLLCTSPKISAGDLQRDPAAAKNLPAAPGLKPDAGTYTIADARSAAASSPMTGVVAEGDIVQGGVAERDSRAEKKTKNSRTSITNSKSGSRKENDPNHVDVEAQTKQPAGDDIV
ncbi:unnamed protein product [Amoebophrya sp. A120]|nr:unnamed protein product [Amoebophrya sp. A120]|eukprot:GSA120T00010727001.1